MNSRNIATDPLYIYSFKNKKMNIKSKNLKSRQTLFIHTCVYIYIYTVCNKLMTANSGIQKHAWS